MNSNFKTVDKYEKSSILLNDELFVGNLKNTNSNIQDSYVNELSITIDMFDKSVIKVCVFDKTHPENNPLYVPFKDKMFVYEYHLGPKYMNNQYDISHFAHNNIITSKYNNTPYSYEVWCAVMLEYIINNIQDSYSSMYNKYYYDYNRQYIHLSQYKVKTITFIVNDTFNFKTLNMVNKLLYNKYIFKYIKYSSAYNNLMLIDQQYHDKVCFVTFTNHVTEITYLKYDNINKKYIYEKTNKTEGIIDVFKKLLKKLPDCVKINNLKDLIIEIYDDLTLDILDVYERDDYDCITNKSSKNILVQPLREIIDEYVNNVISLIDKNYVIYFNHLDDKINDNQLSLLIINKCKDLQYNIKYNLNFNDIIYYTNTEFIIYYIAQYSQYYNNYNFDPTLKQLYANTDFDTFKKQIKRQNLYPNFIDSEYIPFVKLPEFSLSKNLLDLYTLKTNINSIENLTYIGRFMHENINKIFNINPTQSTRILKDINGNQINNLSYNYEYDIIDGKEHYNGYTRIPLKLNHIVNMINKIPNYNNINELLKRYVYDFINITK